MASSNLSNNYTVSPLGIISGYIGSYGTSSSYSSLFSSYSRNGVKRKMQGSGSFQGSVLSDKRHSDEIYDISTSNIIDKLNDPRTPHIALSYADFAYLKDFGVYPNNRLVVCRRFPVPVIDDLYSLPTQGNGKSSLSTPLSTVLGFIPENDNFLKFSFNEEWEDSEVSFTSLLNSLGKDFGFNLGGGLGSVLEGAANAVPLPGATLLLQRKIMASLGFFGPNISGKTDSDGNFIDNSGNIVNASSIPQGDPNLIKQAMNRTLIGEDKDGGSGLKCKFSFTIKTVYEQKFIQGVDPTIVFMDILNNALNLGTSNANFYLGKQNDAAGNVSKYLNDFMSNPFEKIKEFIESLITAMSDQLSQLDKKMQQAATTAAASGGSSMVGDINTLISKSINSTTQYVKDFITQKYKVKFIGIINALTGGPSTPWHITIGNPLRPIFCSGDMLCKNVEVNLGPQLSFNDLPTFIEVDITLESARNLGLQEIFAKFNCGGIRTTSGNYLSGDSNSYWNSNYPSTGTASGTNSPFINQNSGSSGNPQTNKNNTNSTNNPTKVSIPNSTTYTG